ncbi:plasmid transfer protein TraA [Streptomyces sp. NPDC087525]|uniref:plasmid transfer protein TraA n=1 Tax=Streptomyces sp. NPDC087525 TaxID=3365793 RepID=UPI0037F7159A
MMATPDSSPWWTEPAPHTSAASVPPRPRAVPNAGARGDSKTTNKSSTRVGGGFNPSLNLTVAGKPGGASTVGQQAASPAAGAGTGGKIPGSDFMSNEDIRAFCEHLRKESRNRATERAMDADHLEAVLRAIPDLSGSLGGSRARARRVTRWLKKVAAAEKAIQKYSASVYATFEREYDSELRKIGKGKRSPRSQPVRNQFGWR